MAKLKRCTGDSRADGKQLAAFDSRVEKHYMLAVALLVFHCVFIAVNCDS